MFFVPNAATLAATSAGSGIAARYPGDKNIASDPAVILADDFESYTRQVSSATNGTSVISHETFESQPNPETSLPVIKR